MISTTSKAAGFLLFAVSPLAFAQTPPPQPSPGAAPPPMHVQGLTVTPKNGQTRIRSGPTVTPATAGPRPRAGLIRRSLLPAYRRATLR